VSKKVTTVERSPDQADGLCSFRGWTETDIQAHAAETQG
jgi:hypothetical protein